MAKPKPPTPDIARMVIILLVAAILSVVSGVTPSVALRPCLPLTV